MSELLILHPTPTAQWQALVSDAEKKASITLSEELESYLIFLLMRFVGESEISTNPIAWELLQGNKKLGSERVQALRDVGDKCLLFAGLFPGVARRRRVRISYYVKIGQNAYASLALAQENALADLFSKLGEQFVGLMDVLHTMRAIDETQTVLDCLQAEELWADTKSQFALKILRQVTASNPLFSSCFLNEQKH